MDKWTLTSSEGYKATLTPIKNQHGIDSYEDVLGGETIYEARLHNADIVLYGTFSELIDRKIPWAYRCYVLNFCKDTHPRTYET